MPLPPRASDLAPYELVLSVATLGSMGRAATAHGISQAAVSARIRSLEGALGISLFERSPRGTHLTPSGSLVADWARTVIEAAWSMEEGVTALRAERSGRLRVAASLTVAEYLLPRWLVALRTDQPHTSVSLTTHNSTDVVDDVLSAAVDLGFVEGPDLGDDLDGQVVARDHLTVVVAPQHPWSRWRVVDGTRLATTPLVTRERGSGTREFLERALNSAGTGPLAAPVLELNSTTAIKHAVTSNIGPAVLSSLAVSGEVNTGTLVAVPVRGLSLQRRLTAVWPRGSPPTGPPRELLRLIERTHSYPAR